MTGNRQLWERWKASATRTRSRLARLIKNQHRLPGSAVTALLGRIDSAIERDRKLQADYVDSRYPE